MDRSGSSALLFPLWLTLIVRGVDARKNETVKESRMHNARMRYHWLHMYSNCSVKGSKLLFSDIKTWMSAREWIMYLRVKQLILNRSFSLRVTALEKKKVALQEEMGLKWPAVTIANYIDYKGHVVTQCCLKGTKYSGVILESNMCISKVLLSKLMASSVTWESSLRGVPFSDIFFVLHVDSSCTTTLIVEI